MAGLGCGDDELVHDAAGRVYVNVFCAATKSSNLLLGQGYAGVGEDCHGGGDFHRSGGA